MNLIRQQLDEYSDALERSDVFHLAGRLDEGVDHLGHLTVTPAAASVLANEFSWSETFQDETNSLREKLIADADLCTSWNEFASISRNSIREVAARLWVERAPSDLDNSLLVYASSSLLSCFQSICITGAIDSMFFVKYNEVILSGAVPCGVKVKDGKFSFFVV